ALAGPGGNQQQVPFGEAPEELFGGRAGGVPGRKETPGAVALATCNAVERLVKRQTRFAGQLPRLALQPVDGSGQVHRDLMMRAEIAVPPCALLDRSAMRKLPCMR